MSPSATLVMVVPEVPSSVMVSFGSACGSVISHSAVAEIVDRRGHCLQLRHVDGVGIHGASRHAGYAPPTDIDFAGRRAAHQIGDTAKRGAVGNRAGADRDTSNAAGYRTPAERHSILGGGKRLVAQRSRSHAFRMGIAQPKGRPRWCAHSECQGRGCPYRTMLVVPAMLVMVSPRLTTSPSTVVTRPSRFVMLMVFGFDLLVGGVELRAVDRVA